MEFFTLFQKKTASIGPKGGAINLHDVQLELGAECLSNDTEISLDINKPLDFVPRSMLQLSLVDGLPLVVDFRPESLKLKKLAVLGIKLKKKV